MTYAQVKLKIQKYLKNDSNEDLIVIEDLINECSLELVREKEWRRTLTNVTFTRDGSEEYLLSTIITADTDPYFESEKELLTPSSDNENYQDLQKTSRPRYIKAADNTSYWSIDATKIYIKGSAGEVYFFYYSPGITFPLVNKTDTNFITQYYWDILCKWVEWRFFEWAGDTEGAQAEQAILAFKVKQKKSQENRAFKSGQEFIISAHNRGVE